ncbi:MAG: hypothetical protein AB7N76_22090 [Planctomycetota bacterium]
MLAVVALVPFLVWATLWLVPGAVSAQLTWSFRAGPRPHATEGPALLAGEGGRSGSWYRTSAALPRDPWGHPYYVEDPDDDEGEVVSAGPNGVCELGLGDDVRVAGFVFFGAATLLVVSCLGGVLLALAGALLWLAWRQAHQRRSPRAEVELARAAVVTLPFLSCCLCLAFDTDLDRWGGKLTRAWVPPRVAIAGTLAFLLYLLVLYARTQPATGRLRRRSADESSGAAPP